MNNLKLLKFSPNSTLQNFNHRSNSTINKITIKSNILKKFRLNKQISNQNTNDNSNQLQSPLSTKNTKKEKSLEKMFKHPQLYKKNILKFYNITKPKSPFSIRKIEDKEKKKFRLIHKKPSRLFQDCNTINWFRNKYSDKMIKKSIYSLLPNCGIPVIPENEDEESKRHREMIMFLNSFKGPKGREKFININPKYFYDSKTFQTILKLKKIFLEFDEDGNRRMEIDEMYKMFNENHINVNFDELVDLFFTGKKFKKEDIMKLYLDFYQFLQFALNKGDEYRQFMRNIKKKRNKKNEYLPMSFNSTLDYFIFKGKERSSKEIIKKALDEMDKIINVDKKQKTEKLEKKLDFRGDLRKRTFRKSSSNSLSSINLTRRESRIFNFDKINKDVRKVRKSIKIRPFNIEDLVKDIVTYNFDYDDQLKKINFNQLIHEFYKLFNLDNDKFRSDNDEDNYYYDTTEEKNKLESKKSLKNVIFPKTKSATLNKRSFSTIYRKSTNDRTIKLKKSKTVIGKNFEKIKLLDLNNKNIKGLSSALSPLFVKKKNIFNFNNKGIFVTADRKRANSSNKKNFFDYVPLKLLEPPKTNFTKDISSNIQDILSENNN